MRITLHDRVSAEEDRAEQGGADLANAAANAFDGSPAVDDERFGKTIVQADIAENVTHREGLTRRNQHAMETRDAIWMFCLRSALEPKK
jgi:hypothetical protein